MLKLDLCQVNNHTDNGEMSGVSHQQAAALIFRAVAWKDYFLEHLDRLYVRAYPRAAEHKDIRRSPPLSTTEAPRLER